MTFYAGTNSDTPSLSTLPEDIRNMDSRSLLVLQTVVGLLESRCEEWLETVQALSYVNSARLVPDDAFRVELPLEEIYFEKALSLLEPISNGANDRNGQSGQYVYWVCFHLYRARNLGNCANSTISSRSELEHEVFVYLGKALQCPGERAIK